VASNQPMLPGMPRNRDIMTPEKRYPKGYTPDRYAAVASALKDVVFKYHAEDFIPGKGTAIHARSDKPARDPNHYEKLKTLQAQAIEAIANSSVNPEHLAGINAIHFHEKPIQGQKTTAGLYESGDIHIRVPGFTGKNRNYGLHTLLHEIGHHVTLSAEMSDKIKSQVSGRSEGFKSGMAEGIADNYANKKMGKQNRGGVKVDPTTTDYGKDALYTSPIEWGNGYLAAHPKAVEAKNEREKAHEKNIKAINNKNSNIRFKNKDGILENGE